MYTYLPYVQANGGWSLNFCVVTAPQIDINVEREVLNHKQLVHPNVVQFKEVRESVPNGMLTTIRVCRHFTLQKPDQPLCQQA